MIATTSNEPGALPESVSLLLDILRLAAALMVVVAHTTHVEFQLGYRDLQVLGDIAVPVFFVLSGFVIRYVTRTRESTLAEYSIDRASRMYSVVLPALAFTLAASLVCVLLDRHRFVQDGWSDTFNHPLLRLVANLFFFSQAWGRNTIPFINSPFWSLGYECIYYALYGCLFYRRSWRSWAVCIAIVIAIGPQVMFLFPIWWLGCFLYDLYLRFRRTATALITVACFALWLLAGSIFSLLGSSHLLRFPLTVFQYLCALPNPLVLAGLSAHRATMMALSTGFMTFIFLLPLLWVVDYISISGEGWAVRQFRAIANGTFMLYLGHYPFLVLLLFLGLLQRPIWRTVTVVSAMCAVLIAAAAPSDRFKAYLRRRLRRHFASPTPLVAGKKISVQH